MLLFCIYMVDNGHCVHQLKKPFERVKMCVVFFEFCEFCMELCPDVALIEKCWIVKRQNPESTECPCIIYKVKDTVCYWCLDNV